MDDRMSNEITTLSHDEQLRQDIADGKISQSEVDGIWAATEDLPATTPIETRRAVIAIRKAGQGHDPIEAMALAYPHFMRFVIDSVARTEQALTRDESKFSHLVAGSESIVRSMQNVGVLENRLAGIERGMTELCERIGELTELMSADKRKELDGGGTEDETAPTSEPTLDEEVEAELARKRTIGSAWAK